MQEAAVAVGPHITLLFTDSPEDAAGDELMRGVHICVYICDFSSVLHRLHEADITWTNPRFAYLDRCSTPEEALRCRQFRFKDAQDTQGKIFELEHETRAMTHVQYMKHLTYIPI